MAFRPLSHAFGQPFVGPVDDVATDLVAALGDRILVVEDLHWADPATVAVLRELIGRIRMVVTSRSSAPLGNHHLIDQIELEPLDLQDAAELARQLHPELTDNQRDALVAAAAGNPLLIEHLAREGDVSPTLRAAVADRLAGLPGDVIDDLGRLALLGAPVSRVDVVSLADHADGLTADTDDGRIWFTHDLLSVAVRESIGEQRLGRLRSKLVVRLPPAVACHHYLALGDRVEAARAARTAAAGADPTERSDLLTLAVDALGDDASGELLLDAAAAAIDAHRPNTARRFAAAVQGDHEMLAEAGLHLARAAWLEGDQVGAAEVVDRSLMSVCGTHSEVEAKLAVERAFIAVRRRVGDPRIVALADDAVDMATRSGTCRARALNTAGLARSHAGQPGWRELFAAAHEAARREEDQEEQLAARYWLLSALGFYGPMSEAIELGKDMVEGTSRLRARRWYQHFLGAHIIHLSARGDAQDHHLVECHRLLRETPLFRNRAQVELALVVAHLDRGDLDQCTQIVAAGLDVARGGEDVALLASARCEIALARRDTIGMREALGTIIESGASFFGLNAVAESAAINLAFGRPGELDPPGTVTTLTPVLDVVQIEREAHDRQLAGDLDGAIRTCRQAAEQWDQRGFHRFARRARLAQVEIAVAAGELDRGERLLVTIAPSWRDVSSRRRDALEREIGRLRARRQVTRRELEILDLVGDGLTSRQIAERLGVSVSTIDSHVDAAMRRLGARTRLHAASIVRP